MSWQVLKDSLKSTAQILPYVAIFVIMGIIMMHDRDVAIERAIVNLQPPQELLDGYIRTVEVVCNTCGDPATLKVTLCSGAVWHPGPGSYRDAMHLVDSIQKQNCMEER